MEKVRRCLLFFLFLLFSVSSFRHCNNYCNCYYEEFVITCEGEGISSLVFTSFWKQYLKRIYIEKTNIFQWEFLQEFNNVEVISLKENKYLQCQDIRFIPEWITVYSDLTCQSHNATTYRYGEKPDSKYNFTSTFSSLDTTLTLAEVTSESEQELVPVTEQYSLTTSTVTEEEISTEHSFPGSGSVSNHSMIILVEQLGTKKNTVTESIKLEQRISKTNIVTESIKQESGGTDTVLVHFHENVTEVVKPSFVEDTQDLFSVRVIEMIVVSLIVFFNIVAISCIFFWVNISPRKEMKKRVDIGKWYHVNG